MAAPRVPVVKLIVISLILGLILSWFNATPETVYAWVGETGQEIILWVYDFGERIGPYVLMGAMLVLPVWGVLYLWRWFKNR